MSLIVQKFGGSSVADAQKLKNVAGIITDTYKAGNQVVVVVSAQGDTTDELIEKAKEVNPSPSKREMDVLLSVGEQISISLLAMTIEKMGFPVISLTGWQVGMKTDSNYGNARISSINSERLHNELSKKNIIIVAGFQGINKYDDITTLGRGGSDTSAVALATALKADLCQIYTDVDGVYTADPRKIPTAKKLNEITFDEMLELASLGAQVLHNRSVELAKKHNLELEVISSLERKPGTKVKEAVNMEKMLVRGVAVDNDISKIAIIGLPDKPGIAFKIFSILSSKKVNVDVILQSVGRDNTKDISFTVKNDDLDLALKIINENLNLFGASKVVTKDTLSKVSLVGAGMQSNSGVAAKMFEALSDANINIDMITTSEIKISVIIARDQSEKAAKVIHDAFFNN